MDTKQLAIAMKENRLNLLKQRDPVGNKNIINKLTREIKNMKETV